ncbi:hypothetical protein V8E36_001047 [Tilletia maclaganii]
MAKDKSPSSNSDVLLYFLAIFLPPASVFIKRGCGADFWINILLCVLAWLPGLIHAWWLISKYPESDARVASVTPAATPYHHHATQAPAPGATVPQANYAPPSYQPPAQGVPPPTKH